MFRNLQFPTVDLELPSFRLSVVSPVWPLCYLLVVSQRKKGDQLMYFRGEGVQFKAGLPLLFGVAAMISFWLTNGTNKSPCF